MMSEGKGYKIIEFDNGMVMVFDEQGEQRSEYQGKWEDVKDKLVEKFPDAEYNYGNWRSGWKPISKDEFVKSD